MAKQLTARTMREVITFQQQKQTENARGELVPRWVDMVTVRAEATPTRSRDFFAAGKEQLPCDVVFRIRWRSDIDHTHRIVWRGQPYGIQGKPADVDGRRRTLEMMGIEGIGDGR